MCCSEDGKTLTVVPQTSEFFNGNYAVYVPVAVTDKDGNAVEAYSSIVSLKDSVRPTIGAATYPNNNAVKFAFSEPVNLANGAALEGISTLKDKDGAVVSNTGLITLSTDKKSFELDMSTLTEKETYTLSIVGAKDFAGNLISPNPVTVTFVKANADTVDPKVVSVEAVNDTNLIVTFSEAIKDTAGTFFKLDIATTGAVPITATEAKVSDDKTEFNINLESPALSTLKAVASGLAKVDITEFQDLSGNPRTATESSYSKLVNFVADTDAPEVEKVTVETIGGVRYIAVKYDEDVTLTAADLTPVTYVADGVQKTLAGGIKTAAVIPHTDTNIKDTILINTENYDGLGTVDSVLPEGAYKITLPAALVADAVPLTSASEVIEVTIGELSSKDTTKPIITGGASGIVVVDNDTITVQFSEEVTNATALNPANYTIDGVRAFDSAIFVGDKTKVELTLKEGIITLGGDRLIEVKNVADKAGNVMKAESYTIELVENVKPKLVSAKFTDPDEITVTFSENIQGTGVFEVYIDGVKANEPASVAAATGKTAVITLNDSISLTKTYEVKYISGITDAAAELDGTASVNNAVTGIKVTVTE